MKRFTAAILPVVGLTLVGCGSQSHNSGNINGTWNATLTDSNSTTVFTFGTSLVVNRDGSLSSCNFQFTTTALCFVSGETETGSFALSGNFNGTETGAFGFTVKSGTPAGNTRTLAGTANGNTNRLRLHGDGYVHDDPRIGHQPGRAHRLETADLGGPAPRSEP